MDGQATADDIITIVNYMGQTVYPRRNVVDLTGKNLKSANVVVIFLSIIALFIASKGFSILYLFLLADLLCCSAVFPVFYGFYHKKFNEKKAIISILMGLSLGLLIFPSPDFTKSLLIGILLPFDLFPQIISSSLLFWSFLLATLGPVIVIIGHDSFKRR